MNIDVSGVSFFEGRPSGIPGQTAMAPGTGGNKTGFNALLQEKAKAGLNFSKHAAKRMNERGIAVDNQLMSDLEHAVEDARRKGARDVAIIGRQGVFIVNVPNNTVVTTMSQNDMKERVFTNIDSAVLM